VEEIREVSDTDIYGTSRATQLRFKNGDSWNLGMISKKDKAAIMKSLRYRLIVVLSAITS
jgi:hypothetical protein